MLASFTTQERLEIMITLLVGSFAAFLPIGIIAFFLIHVFSGGITPLKSSVFLVSYCVSLIVAFALLMMLHGAVEFRPSPFWLAVMAQFQGFSLCAAAFTYWVSRHPKFDPEFIPEKLREYLDHESPAAYMEKLNRFKATALREARVVSTDVSTISHIPSTPVTSPSPEPVRELVTVHASIPNPEPVKQAQPPRPTGRHRLKRPGE